MGLSLKGIGFSFTQNLRRSLKDECALRLSNGVDAAHGIQKSRRILLRAIATVGLLSVIPPGWAVERPPFACKRIGETVMYRGRKFTCIRVKKKLMWDQGVVIATPTSKPSLSQNPSASPSATTNETPKVEGSRVGSQSPSAQPTPTKSKVLFAKSTEIPMSGSIVIAGKDQLGRPLSVAFTRTKGAIVALEAFCTHSGCVVRPMGKELACPCHFSVFDPETGSPGNPSQQGAYPLPRLEVVEESGAVFLWL